MLPQAPENPETRKRRIWRNERLCLHSIPTATMAVKPGISILPSVQRTGSLKLYQLLTCHFSLTMINGIMSNGMISVHAPFCHSHCVLRAYTTSALFQLRSQLPEPLKLSHHCQLQETIPHMSFYLTINLRIHPSRWAPTTPNF